MNTKCAKIVLLALLAALLLPSLAMAQTGTRATFFVTKTFADGNDVDEVEVSIDCTAGTILDQDKTLGDGDFVEFVVVEYSLGELNCSITETTGVNGYTASYAATNNGDISDAECTWEAIDDRAFAARCDITNTPDEVDVVITKNWVIEGENNNVFLGYDIRARCNNVFDEEDSGFRTIGFDEGTGPNSDQFTFSFRPGFPDSTCNVRERTYDSAIETNNPCTGLKASAGMGITCTITNTVFFEGIPTLSQYGMAIMALLMLGVGFVGFRRFV